VCATTNVAEQELYVLTFREYKNRLALVKNRIPEVNLPALSKMQLVGQHDAQLQTLFFKALRELAGECAWPASEFLNIISNNWMRLVNADLRPHS